MNSGERLHKLEEAYWRDFSKLVARYVSKTPADLHRELLMRLQDRSSVYGSNYRSYLK